MRRQRPQSKEEISYTIDKQQSKQEGDTGVSPSSLFVYTPQQRGKDNTQGIGEEIGKIATSVLCKEALQQFHYTTEKDRQHNGKPEYPVFVWPCM